MYGKDRSFRPVLWRLTALMNIKYLILRAFLTVSLAAFFSGLITVPACADAKTVSTAQASDVNAEIFVSELVERLRILAADDTTDANRKDAVSKVLAEDMATSRLQSFLLSGEQRKALTPAQIAEYDAVFPRYITAAFANSIDQLVSRTIKVTDVLERRPGDFIVRSKLFSPDGQARASLDWRVLEKGGQKQLVDVIVDGLSFNVERRAQFTSILNNEGFPALIAHMNEIAGERAA